MLPFSLLLGKENNHETTSQKRLFEEHSFVQNIECPLLPTKNIITPKTSGATV